MQFTLSTSSSLYYDHKEMDLLKTLGFTFSEVIGFTGILRSKIRGNPTIEINTLEELNLFTETYGYIIIGSGEIEIYNGYRE